MSKLSACRLRRLRRGRRSRRDPAADRGLPRVLAADDLVGAPRAREGVRVPRSRPSGRGPAPNRRRGATRRARPVPHGPALPRGELGRPLPARAPLGLVAPVRARVRAPSPGRDRRAGRGGRRAARVLLRRGDMGVRASLRPETGLLRRLDMHRDDAATGRSRRWSAEMERWETRDGHPSPGRVLTRWEATPAVRMDVARVEVSAAEHVSGGSHAVRRVADQEPPSRRTRRARRRRCPARS